MHPERFAFIVLHDIMGWEASAMARHLSSEGIPTTEGDILVLMASPLYEAERKEILESFRRAAVRNAGDILVTASAEAAKHLTQAMQNMLLKPSQRLRAAIEILDHVPETSKTLRQYVSISTNAAIPDDMADRMADRLRLDPKAAKALKDYEEERNIYQENLKALINR